tara:strand:+ start:482 stop:2056 length:1575 start_codon:yes stop_codon:yes gene_type:complete
MENTIKSFNLDLSDVAAAGETRNFSVIGDKGAVFSLEIKNEDNYYYNFVTGLFQAAKARLSQITITDNVYNGSVNIPKITDDDQYDIYLWAEPGTKHTTYNEVRFGDGSIDINSSSGSGSLLLQKVIYQYTDLTISITSYSPNGTIETNNISATSITASRGKNIGKIPFRTSFDVSTATKAYQILKQPVFDDILSFISVTIGSAPVNITGEDIYPAVSNTDTVNGAVSDSNEITMDTAVATKMVVGDKVTGFTLEEDYAQPVTVTSLASTYVFNTSENISASDGVTLSFRGRKNHQWPITDVSKITSGMIVVPSTNISSGTITSPYQSTITLNTDTDKEETIVLEEVRVTTTTANPTITNGVITSQAGNVVFNNQQVLALASDTGIKIGGYGEIHAKSVFGYDFKFTDLKVELSPIRTTTTSAVSANASVPITSRNGILDNVSSVSGIGIDTSSTNPIVASGAGSVSGSGTIVLNTAQTLESGIVLTFTGAGQTAIITGNVEVVKVGTANCTLRFDVEKLVSIT